MTAGTPRSRPRKDTAQKDTARKDTARKTKPHKETALSRVPVWVWRALMHRIQPGELHKFNVQPIDTVDYHLDLDYAGDGIRDHRLDVMVPHDAPEPLPVYIYFHGGGWTSGDKAPLTKYCASQAADGMIVVNANYRMATHFQLKHMLEDANEVLDWVARHIERFAGSAETRPAGTSPRSWPPPPTNPSWPPTMASAHRSTRRTCAVSYSTAASRMSR